MFWIRLTEVLRRWDCFTFLRPTLRRKRRGGDSSRRNPPSGRTADISQAPWGILSRLYDAILVCGGQTGSCRPIPIEDGTFDAARKIFNIEISRLANICSSLIPSLAACSRTGCAGPVDNREIVAVVVEEGYVGSCRAHAVVESCCHDGKGATLASAFYEYAVCIGPRQAARKVNGANAVHKAPR